MDLPSPLFLPPERESLKEYLAKRLAPICDADVNLLGDYILALLTHDNASPAEIRKLCLRQLEDFLRADTPAFVQDLFEALRSKSFIPRPAPQTQQMSKKRLNEQPNPPFSKKIPRYNTDQRDKDEFPSFQFPQGPADFSNPWPSLVQYPGWENGIQPQRTAKCRDYEEKGFCMRGDTCPYDHGTDRIIVNGNEQLQIPFASVGFDCNSSSGAYDPANGLLPGRRNTPRGRGRGTVRGFRQGLNDSHTSQQPRPPLPPRGPNYDESITSLVVQNLPPEHLEKSSIEMFFSKFGTIESTTLYPEFNQAIIKFEKYQDAKLAYDSPEPIFNNRFVKVFWERKSDARFRKPLSKQPNVTTPTQSPEDLALHIQRKQSEFEARQAKKKEHEMKLAEIERQKRDLLEKQARQQEELDNLLAKRKGQTPEPSPSESLKLNEVETTMQNTSAASKSTGDVLRAQLQALQAEAAQLGIDASQATRSYPYPRGGYKGGRGGSYRGGRPLIGSKKLDNRPKSVIISEIPSGKDEQICQYLLQIGGYESIAKESDHQIVHFKERWIAEKLMSTNGNIPQVGQVKLSWTATHVPDIRNDHESPSFHETDHKEREDNHMDEEDGERRWKG